MKYIYLHGFASGPTSTKARYFARRFAEAGVAVEVPALDGGDFENLTITGQLAIMEELAGGKPVCVMGSSMGGYLAALYASLHPETAKVVLLAPAFCFTRRWPSSLGEQRLADWRRSGRMTLFHYGEQREREIGYGLHEDGTRYPDYPDFSQPALIIHGAHDDVVPADYSRHFAATHPNVILHVVESGHELTDQLEFMWQEMNRFLLCV